MSEGPVLVGTGGFVRGEAYPLSAGSTVVIGRSRSCDISLRRCKAWLALEPEDRDEERDFRTVSRKHTRIRHRDDGTIEVEDLSSNGTFLNGERIRRAVISDLRERSYELLLGTREKFRLQWRSHD
ncbi:MAG: FHA domain-containing protein [Candidatus Brocadiia bacterium]